MKFRLVPHGRRRPLYESRTCGPDQKGPPDNSPKGALRRFRPALIALALSGCATTRYVMVACIDQPQLQRLKDAEPPRVGEKLTGQAQDDFKIAAGSAVELRSYSHGLLGVLEGCVEPKVSTIGDK